MFDMTLVSVRHSGVPHRHWPSTNYHSGFRPLVSRIQPQPGRKEGRDAAIQGLRGFWHLLQLSPVTASYLFILLYTQLHHHIVGTRKRSNLSNGPTKHQTEACSGYHMCCRINSIWPFSATLGNARKSFFTYNF